MSELGEVRQRDGTAFSWLISVLLCYVKVEREMVCAVGTSSQRRWLRVVL